MASGGKGAGTTKSGRRKISLPWFRQGSSAGPALARQHTIDTPSSLHKRFLRKQPSHQAGGVEMTWVICDHVAAGTGQLSVNKGQQVEVVETAGADWALVRLPSSGLDPPPEGLVPLTCLKQPPHGLKPSPVSPSRRLHPDHEIDPGPSEGVATTNSPVNKRRVFMGRKWLPPPLRKLSTTKVEKNQTPEKPPLKKTPSDKRFKSPTSESKPSEDTSGQNGDEADEEVLELPPPMKPISEPLLVPSSDDAQTQRSSTLSLEGATSADLAEIEQIVKERMEQHSEKTSHATPVKSPPPPPPPPPTEKGESPLHKRKYVIDELITSERAYVSDLSLVVDGYMELMKDAECSVPMPEELRSGRATMVFGNLKNIYEWHRDSFLKALERCSEHPEELGYLFKKYEEKLRSMYVIYCQNKPKSEYIVSDFESYFEDLRQKLGHKLQLNDLLIKPVQRIMKYQLLLDNVCMYTERAGLTKETETLKQDINVLQLVVKSANDMMDVGKLQGFDGKITSLGKLLLHGTLLCCEGTTTANFKGKELVVFLFEQTIIFSEAHGKKTTYTNPIYIYKAQIQVNKMSLDENIDDSSNEAFIIRSTDPKKPGTSFVCLPLTPEQRTEWLANLKSLLQKQLDFLNALQQPIQYQNKLTKDPKFASREPSLPLAHTECPEVYVSQSHCKRQSILGGFRATLRRARSEVPQRHTSHVRRWSDSHENCMSSLVSNLHDEERERKRRLSYSMEQSSSSDGENGSAAVADQSVSRSWEHWAEEPLYRRYQQLDLIGIGKSSEVYAGKDIVTSQEVALKIIDRRRLPSEDGAKNEYRKLSGLCHRNIVSGLALFTESPKELLDTIVMIRVKGLQILEYICSIQGKEVEVKRLYVQLVYALQYLLSQHTVHGDIKPENVLVENDGTLKLIDFGPSEPDEEFGSPEAFTERISYSSDMWGFGVLLYVTLSGVSPFLDDSQEETLNNICTGNFSFPPDYFLGVPEDALFLVTSVLAPDPDQRAHPNSLLLSPWFKQNVPDWSAPVERLLNFIERRRKSTCGL